MALDSQGNVYIADAGNTRIQKFTNNGVFILKWGSNGGDPGQFQYPRGVTVDSEGFVYVADTGNGRIQKFTSDGQFISAWGSFNGPNAIAYGPNGLLYLADSGNNRIQVFTTAGLFVTQWGSFGSTQGTFSYPIGLDVDQVGNVYVADRDNNRVQKFSSSGALLATFGSLGNATGLFLNPRDVAIGPNNAIYVADTDNDRVQKFQGINPEFAPEAIHKWGSVGSTNGQFSAPSRIAIGADGSVYVSDSHNNRIQRFSKKGAFLGAWGSLGTGDGEFNTPIGVTVGPDGLVYVADGNNHRVEVFTSAGIFVRKWGSQGSGPGEFNITRDLISDSSGNIYVVDRNNHRIQKFSADGTFLTAWGSLGSAPGQFNSPQGIALDSQGFVYVSDTVNDRIQKFTSTGVFVSTWGGAGVTIGLFNLPRGLSFDSAGKLYVVDSGNSRIQKFTSAGVFLGSWGGLGAADGQLNLPEGIFVGDSTEVFVADTGNNRIQRYSYSPSPFIQTIRDVPNDQGRQVRIVFHRSPRDASSSSTPILRYDVWRKVSESVAASAPRQIHPSSFPPGLWDFVSSVPARAESQYSVVVPTLCDSTITDGQCNSLFLVSATTAIPSFFFDAAVDSGYSIDNLSPHVPSGLTFGSGGVLAWNKVNDSDLEYYSVYGSNHDAFDETAALLSNTTSLEYDTGPTDFQYYYVSASDFSGNESKTAQVAHVTGISDNPVLPTAFALRVPAPNPYRESVRVSFDVPKQSRVVIRIFDLAGREVTTLFDGSKPQGRFDAFWKGENYNGNQVPPGVYFLAMSGGDYHAVRKIVRIM